MDEIRYASRCGQAVTDQQLRASAALDVRHRRRPPPCFPCGATSVAPSDTGGAQPRGCDLLATAPSPELLDEPRRGMRELDRAGLVQQLTSNQGVTPAQGLVPRQR